MGGEREAQEQRNGIRLGIFFAPHWRALSARARYLFCISLACAEGSAALIRPQSMGGEREVQEQRNGIRLGTFFASHWRALSARARYLFCGSLACAEGSAALIRPQPMRGERKAQAQRKGIRLGIFFASHWRALLSKARYREERNERAAKR